MGYYTDFTIKVAHGKVDMEELCDELIRVSEYDMQCDHINGEDMIHPGDQVKWYGCQEDMVQVSKSFPDAVLLVEGIGEEQGDYWRLYLKNGRDERIGGKIVYADSNILAEAQATAVIEEVLSE